MERSKIMKYAAYLRISSEDQRGNFSIDAQRRAVEEWVEAQDGQLVKIYTDEESGLTIDRPEFRQMRRDARNGAFDALVMHKFDRFARDRIDALAIKSLLRHDYGIKVFSTTELSQDSDGELGALVEGLMESVADWYSHNLSLETTKGKRERAMQGYHNNGAPFGLDGDAAGVLTPNRHELPGLHMAFELYATGKHSDNAIARILNENVYISKSGRPFSTDAVRDMLQNRIYLGYVKYQEYRLHPDGRRSWGAPVEWFEGQHKAVIDQELFNRCKQVRAAKATHHEYYPKHRVYLLRDLVYCADCVENKPDDIHDDSYGKMRPHPDSEGVRLYYRCRARDFVRYCSQKSVRADIVDEQVVDVLRTLKLSEDWHSCMVSTIGQLLGDQKLDARVTEIKDIIERMDFRWDNGFISDKVAYLEQRAKLQHEMEELTPIDNNDLARAADLLDNFSAHWEAANGDREKQRQLIQLIVVRVWVRGNQAVAALLRSGYRIDLG
jgi:site-specific DNA recombinase